MAPAVDLVSYGFEVAGGLVQGFLYTDPGDIEADYTEAINLHGADLSNNSIGTNTAPNGFPCEWEGNYGATGALIDEIARGSLGNPFRIVWANGNERGSGACGSTYLTTAPPACAKNHITVGAMNSNDDSVTGFTSWGPCDDGRLKPDISGPGCESGGDSGVTSTNSSDMPSMTRPKPAELMIGGKDRTWSFASTRIGALLESFNAAAYSRPVGWSLRI